MSDGKVIIDVNLNDDQAVSGAGRIKGLLSGLGSQAQSTGSMFKSMLGANLLTGAISTGLSSLKSGVSELAGELNNSSKAWQTFEGNMSMIGKSQSEISAAKKVMQDYATQTIYSASDMAQTYSQLAAVGIEGTDRLVTGFGGLAAAAENPTQAMKTLSQQATQMAAKPTVQWMDFKLTLEQTPAGIAAVAKQMGMSTSEMVTAVQDGRIKTEDFFNAIKEVGNNADFSKMATEFKTIDQAIDGAKESLSNKLMPVFDKFNQFGIKAVVAVTDAMDKIDFGKIADSLGKVLESIDISGIVSKTQNALQMFFNPMFVINFKGALDGVKGAISAIGSAFSGVAGGGNSWLLTASSLVSVLIGNLATGAGVVKKFVTAFAATGAMQQIKFAIDNIIMAYSTLSYSIGNSSIWTTLGTVIGNVVKVIAQVAQAIARFVASIDPSTLSSLTTAIVGVVVGFKTLNFIKSFNPFAIFRKNAENGLNGASNSAKSCRNVLSKVFSGLSNVIKSSGTAIKSAATGIGTGIKTAISGVSPVLRAFGAMLKTAGVANILAFGGAVAIAAVGIGAGIGIIVASLTLLATQSEGVSQIITAIGTAFGTVGTMLIGAFAQAIVTVSGVLPIVASSLAMLSPLVLAIGQAIAATAPFITALGTAFTSILSVIPPIITALGGAISQIATAITPIVSIISDAFVQVVTVVSQAIVQIIQALAPFIPAITQMVQAVAPVLQSLVEAFNNLISQISPIIDSLTQLLQTFGEQVSSILESAGSVVESFGSAIRNVLDGVAGIFESMGNAAKNAGQGVKLMAQGIQILTNLPLGDLTGTLAAVASGLAKIAGSGIGSAGPGLQAAGQGLVMIAMAGRQAQVSLIALPVAITMFTASLTGIQGDLISAAAAISAFAVGAVASLAGLSGANAQISGFTAMIVTIVAATAITNAGLASFNAQASSAGAALSALGAYATVASSQITNLGVGISSTMSGASTAIVTAGTQMSVTMQSSMTQVMTTIRSGMTNSVAAVRSGGSQMVAAFRSSGDQMVTTAQSMVNRAVSAIRSGRSQMQSAGSYLGQGVAAGMDSSLGAVTAAANRIIAKANEAAKAAAKIHSPSHLFRDEVGYWIGAGVAKGIDYSVPLVTDSMDMIRDQVSGFKMRAEDVIGGSGASLSSRIKTETLSKTLSKNESTVRVEQNNERNAALLSDVISKMSDLEVLIAQGKQLILDTGALVGGTAGAMDEAIGRNYSAKGRLSFEY